MRNLVDMLARTLMQNDINIIGIMENISNIWMDVINYKTPDL